MVENKTILVTGGTRGIGRAIVLELLENGARVITNHVRDVRSAEKLVDEVDSKNLSVVRADLTREKGVQKLMESVEGVELNGLIHCAATGVHVPFDKLSMKHWDWTMNLNVRAFFELMLKLKSRFSNGASVIALSSEGAVIAFPNYTIIGASKAALESLCRHLAVELCEKNIRVNILSPGSVLTDAWDVFPDKDDRIAQVEAKIPGHEMTTLDEVAAVACFLSSDSSRGINGQTIVVDRGERIAF